MSNLCIADINGESEWQDEEMAELASIKSTGVVLSASKTF